MTSDTQHPEGLGLRHCEAAERDGGDQLRCAHEFLPDRSFRLRPIPLPLRGQFFGPLHKNAFFLSSRHRFFDQFYGVFFFRLCHAGIS